MLVSVADSKVSSSIASFAPPLATPPPHPSTLHYSIRDTGNIEHFAVLHSRGGRWYLDRTNGQPLAITQQSTDLHRNMFFFLFENDENYEVTQKLNKKQHTLLSPTCQSIGLTILKYSCMDIVAALVLMIITLVFGGIPGVLWYSHVFPVL